MKLLSSVGLLAFTLLGATASADDKPHRFEWDGTVGWPQRNYHPDTIRDCSLWYDNMEDESCELIRDIYGISPEDLSRWNPGITLTCGNWQNDTSYCVEVESEWTTTLPPPTSTTTASNEVEPSSSETATTPPFGTPTWVPVGCYPDTDDSDLPAMRTKITPDGGDARLTVSRCQELCFDDDWNVYFAGTEGGNACWCSSFVSSAMIEDGNNKCDIPCAGDSSETCGGDKMIFVYEATYADVLLEPTESTAEPTESTAEPTESTAEPAVETGTPQGTQRGDGREEHSDVDSGTVRHDDLRLRGRIITASVLFALIV